MEKSLLHALKMKFGLFQWFGAIQSAYIYCLDACYTLITGVQRLMIFSMSLLLKMLNFSEVGSFVFFWPQLYRVIWGQMQLEIADPDCPEGGMVLVLCVSGSSTAGLSPACYICGQCQVNWSRKGQRARVQGSNPDPPIWAPWALWTCIQLLALGTNVVGLPK